MRDGAGDAPLDLGVVGAPSDPEADEPGEPDEPRGWARARRLWAVPAAALLVGGLLGAVIVDARHDAAELARVSIVSGPTSWVPAADRSGAVTIELQLMNIGARPVEILGVEAEGLEPSPGTEPAEAVEAPVGDWVVVRQAELVADCEAGAAPSELRVRVRDSDGDERIVTADQNDDYGNIGMYWISQCDLSAGYVQLMEATATLIADDSVTVTLPLLNHSGRAVQITHLVPIVSGLTAAQPSLPIAVAANGTAQVDLTWTVDDCAAALSLRGNEAVVEFTASSSSTQVPEAYPLDAATLVELVRLTARVCD